MWRVLVQQLSILKSTRSFMLIAVNGVPVSWLLNQLPGSSVKCIVSTAPSLANTDGAAAASSARKLKQMENREQNFFMIYGLGSKRVTARRATSVAQQNCAVRVLFSETVFPSGRASMRQR